jgi:hypothetical protein
MDEARSAGSARSVPPQDAVASFDSASAFLESLARALQQRDFPHLGQSRLKVPLVLASRALPLGLRRRAYSIASGREGVRPHRLGDVDLADAADWVAGHYPERRFPALLLGSSNGALTHLAAHCGVPWLPQTLLVPVRRPKSDPRDISAAMHFGGQHARRLLDANPDIHLHHMHDPNQDWLTLSHMAYFRVKWLRLPEAYGRFLRERLLPGAPVIVVRDRSTWPVSRIGDRHTFQLGAQGGMSPEDYLAAPDAPRPDGEAPEAEWGFSGELLQTVRAWAITHGHPVVEISYGHPQDPSAAVAETTRAWLRSRGETPHRLLVSSFVVHDPWRTITTASVPFWTFFPVRRAAQDLSRYLDHAAYDDIDVMLFNHGTDSVGLANARTWQQLADRARSRGRLLALDATAFPSDFSIFARYAGALARLPEASRPWSPLPLDQALSGLAADPRVTVVT